jgi:rhamnogalacturonyl hydrolase YesR
VLRPEPSSASKWESVFSEVLKGLWNRGSSWYFMVINSWYFMVFHGL